MLRTITLNAFPRSVQVAKAQRTQFYTLKKPPKAKKYWNQNHYYWGQDGRLYDKRNKLPVVANPKVARKPRMVSVNGQRMYQGLHYSLRSRFVHQIKNYIKSQITDTTPLPKEMYPIRVYMLMYTPPHEANWDLDNLWIWTKCFMDCLVDLQIIPNDSIEFVSKTSLPEFVPIEEENQRRIIVHITKDDRSVIINSPYYQSLDYGKLNSD